MSVDLFMNDTCPKCRKPLKPAVIEPRLTRHSLAVHKFECSNCGAVQTKVLFRKSSNTPSNTSRTLS
jgi:ssDNA-binding Zn-finger/Zn-ribbon topoisomerase 1